jgi:hypothetical protein
MDDKQYADNIRAAAQALYDATHAARQAGLEVEAPIFFLKWMMTGEGMGGPQDWTIKRKSL